MRPIVAARMCAFAVVAELASTEPFLMAVHGVCGAQLFSEIH
jgi:hypothetical protein